MELWSSCWFTVWLPATQPFNWCARWPTTRDNARWPSPRWIRPSLCDDGDAVDAHGMIGRHGETHEDRGTVAGRKINDSITGME